MIERKELLAFEFYRKKPFKGSDRGMRYMISKEEDRLKAYAWPEPFSFEVTSEEKKIFRLFDFSEEGLTEAMDWLNSVQKQIASEAREPIYDKA